MPEIPSTFDRRVKHSALRLLLEYSAITGKKWTAIRNEIVRVTNAPVSKRTPLITRTDLEGWAQGRSTLRDDKFVWVFRFLVSPETLCREEFRGAENLLVPRYEQDRIGGALSNLYNIPIPLPRVSPSVPVGLFVSDHEVDGREIALHFTPICELGYYTVHLLSVGKSANHDDWDVERMSGYGTFKNEGILHLQDPFRKEREVLHFGFSADGIDLVDSSSLIKTLLRFKDDREIRDIMMNRSEVPLRLTRSNRRLFLDFVDTIQEETAL